MFGSLGLTDELLAVYRALLQDPELTQSARHQDLADRLNLTSAAAESALETLRELELLVPGWIEGWEYAVDPAIAFERMSGRRQQELDGLAQALRADQDMAGKFIADYANFVVQKSTRDVEILEGRERANQRMQLFQPKESIWGLLSAESSTAMDPDNHPDRPNLERGVEIRYVYPETLLRKPGGRDLAQLLFQLGGKVRIAPSTPFRLVIFDGDAAVLGIDPDDSSVGAVVHHSQAVVRMARELFLSYWTRGVNPFEDQQRTREGGISSQESEFLRFLVQGATDEQVARKLGVSMRTVRRMAAKLSEQVGASGRFELGVRAAQGGWVD
ncbi:LuxR C-terminal-related transcriptional regulator [Kribbella sindirgiensis]|uniref:HTH luxR-type domain-containing protein n=1 Tax=Kribbella sindirgiensis TaxID=1124744 RepID=A0A4R0IC19_9ACTN|nr:LuxR C-terminal-related transcriptional regulator [Kribbella sindirgiensis]TCC29919.1 hypothetical protein E0H50_26155 [Kribbella sindirgiensis]